ncbi:B12-binding domain-containing radical SAM protein [Candidatus Latescibacterota bacterium]
MGKVSSLTVVFIRASNYDDDGFVVRYWKGVFPSNTLACMRSLTLDFSERWKRDKGIDIKVETYDDLLGKVPVKRLSRKNRSSNKVIAVLVGVQSNQFPRASDIAKQLTEAGIKTLIGGFHVSGVLSMFDEPTPEIRELIDIGVTAVHGEAENVWESILYDVVIGKEKPLYRLTGFPDISEAPVPQTDSHDMKKFALHDMGTIDCSRGCPFDCSFCTIINIQGHKMRFRSVESVIKTIRKNYHQGIRQYFFTDDNFARNPAWEAIFDGLIRLREDEGMKISFIIQVDMSCDRINNFIEKAARAGCSQVFIGMESINPKNLEAAGKKQNKVENYPSFVESWHRVGVVTHAGYIIGLPHDTPESIKRDIEKLKNEIKVDQASFFIFTPLPGSRDHYNLVQSGAYMDPDLNKYDSFHTVTEHPRMSAEELFKAYQDAWDSFYEFDNSKKILMKSRSKTHWKNNIFNIMWYKNSLLEPRHPMVTGFIRRKNRLDIRPGTRIMKLWKFYPMRARELITGFMKRINLVFELHELWLLTRKADDPKFKLVADFTTALYDTKHRISSIDINSSYTKWSEELNMVLASLKKKITSCYNPKLLKGKTKRRFNNLIDEMNAYLDKFNLSDYNVSGLTILTHYLNTKINLVEEYTFKNVAKRRKIKQFWFLTCERIKQGKIIKFSISIPKILINALRDFPMSIKFVFRLIYRNF